MSKNKFFIEPRDVTYKCVNTSCKEYGKETSVQVQNIYKDEIIEILNCLSCGKNKIKIVKVAIPEKQTFIL